MDTSLVKAFAIVQYECCCYPGLDMTFLVCFCLVLCLELSAPWLMLVVASSSSKVGDVRVLYLQLSKEGLWRVVPPLFFHRYIVYGFS